MPHIIAVMEPNCLRGTRDAAWLHPWLVLLLTWAVRVRGCSAALCLALKSAAKAASDELFLSMQAMPLPPDGEWTPCWPNGGEPVIELLPRSGLDPEDGAGNGPTYSCSKSPPARDCRAKGANCISRFCSESRKRFTAGPAQHARLETFIPQTIPNPIMSQAGRAPC